MANRQFRQFIFGLEPMPVKLYAIITLTGGNGAQTITRGKGLLSVTQSGTGLLTIVLRDPYTTLLGADVQSLPVTYSASTSADHAVLTSATNVSSTTSPQVVLQMVNAAGTAVAAAASDKLLLEITLNNSSAL